MAFVPPDCPESIALRPARRKLMGRRSARARGSGAVEAAYRHYAAPSRSRQYVAIVSGPSPAARARLANTPELREQRHAVVLYVFGL
jgi:hypothetical protein